MMAVVAPIPIIIPDPSQMSQLACVVLVVCCVSFWLFFESDEEFLVFFVDELFLEILVVSVAVACPFSFAPGFASSVWVSTPFAQVAVDLYRSVSSTDVVSLVVRSSLASGTAISTGTSFWVILVVSWVSVMAVSFTCSTFVVSCSVAVSVIAFFFVAHPAKRHAMQMMIRARMLVFRSFVMVLILIF